MLSRSLNGRGTCAVLAFIVSLMGLLYVLLSGRIGIAERTAAQVQAEQQQLAPRTAAAERSVEGIEARLNRIEGKLDRLLERGRS